MTSHPGPLLRQLRKARQKTLKDVSDATGISVARLVDIERGLYARPSEEELRILNKWAEALGHSVNIKFEELT